MDAFEKLISDFLDADANLKLALDKETPKKQSNNLYLLHRKTLRKMNRMSNFILEHHGDDIASHLHQIKSILN